ncbi:unnamed protein product [Eruca vesicaria subsp. sativa]|uniref:Uncharacterized protein n=1 Tax=Eruca vesicaria subsp. sativa TaxID=29727 RepID=A0ABC8KFK8_ERUVS|nr:unnamed protein product [Eruca vesicaria subsp. sativa]
MGEPAEQIRGFHVNTTREQLITVALPVHDHWLPLSNLDLLLPPVNVSVCFCYKKPHNITNSVAHTLKTALAKTLVPYYAFAGEIVLNTAGEPEILCNYRGVNFVEADADVDLRELNLYDPDESIAKLVPTLEHGVIAIQVTELKCGSIVVGCTFDHRVADAYSMNMFLVSWAEFSRSNVPISNVPSFPRSLLNPRRPLMVMDTSIDQMYIPVTSLPLPQETTNPDSILASRLCYIKADNLVKLQTLASGLKRRTKLESFSAFLWKLVAKHAATDPVGVPAKNAKLGIVVDGRRKLIEKERKTYFGNVLSIPFGAQKIDDLISKPLSWVAEEVHKFLDSFVTKAHFLNLVDWVETHRPTPAVSRIYSTGSDDGPAFVVSSGRDFPVSQVDFGWGSPVFGSYHFPWGGNTGYVMPMPSPVVDGDWMVYLHLTKGQLKFIEEDDSQVLKPIDNNYLQI